MEMSLRNGKIKAEPIDSEDDDYEPISRYNTRNSIIQLQTIKIEPEDDDTDADYVDETYKPEPLVVDRVLRVRQPKPKVTKQSDESGYSDECDDVLPLDMNLKRKSMQNPTKPLKSTENNNVHKQKQKRRHLNQNATAPFTATPMDCDEKRSYCCYLCGRTFQHLCRLTTHMPAHTNTRRYQCLWCSKRYKSSSSLNVHYNQYHLGKPRKPRSKSTTKKPNKRAVTKPKIGKFVIKIPKLKLETECEKFVDVKMEPIDNNVYNEMDVSLELDPSEIHEHVPFVWDECDANLTLPIGLNIAGLKLLEMNGTKFEEKKDNNVEIAAATATDAEVIPPIEQTECIDINTIKVEKESPIITTSPLIKPSKLEIWQKETADPLAVYVDILRMPKSKRILFPTELDAPNKSMATHSTSLGTAGNNIKNTALAEQFRALGNVEFGQKNWAAARQWYNRSLCHAEQKTHYFPMAYAKRAQCFFNEGVYRTCWTDLMLSQNSGLPEVLFPRLERYKESCKFLIKRQQMQANQPLAGGSMVPTVQPKLSFAANPKFPEMATALKIDVDEFYGRHLRARQSIGVGQILMIETGFVASTTSFYEKCCICLTADTNLVPCSRCTQALLCKNCVNGWFHHIECELQMSLNLKDNPLLPSVLRSFLIAINLFENVDEMIEFVDDAVSSLHGMKPMAPIIDDKSRYRAFLQLTTAPSIPSEMIPIVVQLHTTLLNHPAIRSKFTSTKHHRFLAHLLVHHICVIGSFTTKVGSAVCENGFTEIVAPITSYLKHSCAPNVSKFFLGKSIIVVAMRPIECGELLCVSYCDVLKTTIDRQNFLQSEYGFQCLCERCQSKIADQQIPTFHCDAAEAFVRENFQFLASNDQIKRKQLTDCVMAILQQFGRTPWNYTIGWAYVIYSLLLSHRFQKKLMY